MSEKNNYEYVNKVPGEGVNNSQYSKQPHNQINGAYGKPTNAPPKLSLKQIMAISGFLIGIMLGALDSTIVGTIMPTVITELGGFHLSSWVFGGYMLAQTAAVPIFGKLSDQFGRKKLYFIGLFIFLVGSVLSGFAQTIEQLIIFRTVQGVGAGSLFPIAMSAIGLHFPPHLRGKLQGFFTAIFGFSSIFGPILGSFFGTYFSWRYAFYINVPIIVLSFILLQKYYKDIKISNDNKLKIDYLGSLLLVSAIFSLLYGVMWAGYSNEWQNWKFHMWMGLFLLLTTCFLFVEKMAQSPIIPLGLFKKKVLIVSFLGNFLSGLMMFMCIFFIPMFIQGVIGGTIGTAGLVLLPLMVGMVIGSTLTGKIIIPFGIRKTGITSMLLFLIGFICLSTMGIETKAWQVILYMAITGVGLGISLVAFIISIQVSIPPQLMGIGSSLAQFFRNLGGVIGVNILAAIQTYLFFHSEEMQSKNIESIVSGIGGVNAVSKALFSGRDIVNIEITNTIRTLFSESTVTLFYFGIGIATIGLFLVFMLPLKMNRPNFNPQQNVQMDKKVHVNPELNRQMNNKSDFNN